jgi:Tol biopolymer transport system component
MTTGISLAAPGDTTRESVDSSGNQANNRSDQPSISADGRYVAFISFASNLVAGDTNGTNDLFVRDRQTGTTQRVSVDSSGNQATTPGPNNTFSAAISADGRYVAFYSDATNLVEGDTNNRGDIFVRDRQAGTTERVSLSTSGTQGNHFSDQPSISADGRYVAFESFASDLVARDTNDTKDAFVRDRQTGTTQRVSVDSSGNQANSSSERPRISADGNFVAFVSGATNLVAGDTNGSNDVFVRELGDKLPPTINIPADITENATSPSGAKVTYTVTATDDIDPNPTLSCDPASGSTFPIGTTTVECTATDSSGNSTNESFNVVVKGAAEQISTLKEDVADLGLESGLNRSLQAKLDDALAHLIAGRTVPACNKLDEFISQVSSQSGKKINPGDAQRLTADANRIKVVLACK